MMLRVFSTLLLVMLFILPLTVNVDLVMVSKTLIPQIQLRTAAAVPLGSPVMFIQNIGQFDERALFLVHGADQTIWLAEDSIWVVAFEQKSHRAEEQKRSAPFHLRTSAILPAQGIAIKISFLGANPHPHIEPFGRIETSVNYFIGNDPAKWYTNVPVWAGVRYMDLYPGINLEMTSQDGYIVQRLVARPGADPNAIYLRIEGADNVEASREGPFLRIAAGDFNLPLLAVEGSELLPVGVTSVQRLNTNSYNITAPFSLTPSLTYTHISARSSSGAFAQSSGLLYATFLGGSYWDGGDAITVDRSGNIYVAGRTNSLDFPTTPGAYDATYNGYGDIFVIKLSPSGSLLYATFLGGSYGDDSNAIAVDRSGNTYIAGDTSSHDFPTTLGAYDTTYNGGGDAFVAKLSPGGNSLLYATFLGGSNSDGVSAIAVDGNGNTYITGQTWSSDGSSSDFPTTQGAYDTTYNGGYTDAFVAKLNSSGSNLLYATLLGGSSWDGGSAIAVDMGGIAYVAGGTSSLDFPTTPGALDTSCDNGEAFVVKLNTDGSKLIYATLLGGNEGDSASDIAIDLSGAMYVTGGTGSPDFPTTSGAFDTSFNGGSNDLYVVKIDATGSRLLYGTFLGGRSDDLYASGSSISIDSSGAAYVTCRTFAYDFPTTPGAFDTSFNGGYDVVIAKLNASGSELAYATFLGGSDGDGSLDIAVDSDGVAFVTGWTCSSDFPTTPGALDRSFNGICDAFVVKMRMELEKIYLPLVLQDYISYFEGPWEQEPNNSAQEANGPLRSGRDYYGYPNDEKDYFSIYLRTSGQISIDLTNHTDPEAQLQLFYQTPGNRVAGCIGSSCHVDYTGPAGLYYIYIYTAGNYNSTTPYTLRVTYPQ